MNTQNAQLNNSDNFIQNSLSLLNEIKEDENLSPLFNKMKEEDEKIYDAVVGFNIVKSLIEYGASWNKSANWKKDEVYEVLQKKLDQIEKVANKLKDKTKQKLQSEVQKELEGYIDGGVHNVAIYGNYASITLKDTKKEFKISEFLNSDFCQKNGISGFSTLHGDGKSGMHGFVHNNIRHYVVTDGSYEMTLNWYVNGEKCTIKIKIDKEGVEFIEGNITQDQKDQLKANRDVKIGGLFLDEIQFRQQKEKENEVQHSKDNNNRSFETATRIDIGRDIGVQAAQEVASYKLQDNPIYAPLKVQSGSKGSLDMKNIPPSTPSDDSGIEEDFDSEINSQNKKAPPPPPLRTSSLKKNVSDRQEGLGHQDGGQKDERYDNPTFTTFGYAASGEKEPVAGEAMQVKGTALTTQDVTLKKVAGAFKSKDAKESGNIGDKQPLQDVHSILAKRAEVEFLHSEIGEDFDNEINSQEAKEKRERRQAARKESSEGQVYNLQSLFEENPQNKKTLPPVPPKPNSLKKNVSDGQEGLGHQDGGQKDERYDNPTFTTFGYTTSKSQKLDSNKQMPKTNQAMDELKGVLKKSGKGLTNPAQQAIEKDIPQDLFSENILEDIEKNKPIYKWLKNKVEGKENNQNLDTIEEKSSQKSSISQGSFSENILEDIEKNKPIYKWLKDKIEGRENNQNLNALDKRLSQKSGQGNIVEKREDDDSKHLSPTSTGGDTHVSDTQLQKGSHRSGKEPEEEERNFQNTKEALEEWKKKRLNKYGKINENIKKASFDTQEKTQPHHTNDLTPLEELTQRLSQKSYGLKQVNPKARYVSPQTRKHLIEAGLLKDDSTDVKKITERENADTDPATDKNRELHKLLEKDAAQLKVGVIEEEREDTPAEYISSHDRNRIALSNKNKLLWTKHVKQQQEKDKDKGVSI